MSFDPSTYRLRRTDAVQWSSRERTQVIRLVGYWVCLPNRMRERGLLFESLRDIRIFLAAYEERSFTAAAIHEHATQSGVSQHIRKLEEGFRVKLFSRAKGQVSPTPAADD